MSCRFAVVLALIMIAASMYSIAGAQAAPEDSSEGGMVFTDEKEDMWGISVEYPHFESRGMVAVKANVDAEAAARAEFEAFLAQAKAEVPEMQESILVGFYMLNVFPTVTMDIRELCSGYVERVEFTGGANAYSSFSALNYAQGTDGVRKLTLADLFYDGSDGTKVASATILAEVQAWDNPASYVLDGTWTELSPEQAQRFVITEVGLLFLFDKYELGCGAEGTYTVLVPYDSLDGLDYEGYLKPLFDDTYRHNLNVLRTGRWVLSEILYNNDTTLTAQTNADGSLVEENWVEFREGGLTGRAGINSFSGEYEARDDGALQIGTLAITKALNPPGSLAEHFERNFPDVTSFMLEDGVLYLQLPYDTGTMVLLNNGVDGVW